MLVVFVVAGVIALILNPAGRRSCSGRAFPRGLAVLAVYLAFFLALAGAGFLLANPISNQVRTFVQQRPAHRQRSEQARSRASRANSTNRACTSTFIKQGKTALQTLQDKVAKSAGKIVDLRRSAADRSANASIELVLVFVLSVYMLVYGERIGALVRRLMPAGTARKADDYPHLVQRAVSRYIGGQLLFSLIMGATAGLALYLFGVLGMFPDGRSLRGRVRASSTAVMELVPYVGPILGAIPPVVVALFTEPITALWVALLFVGLQQLEGHVVAPQIFGHTLRINPLLVIFALLLGTAGLRYRRRARRAADARGPARDGRLSQPSPDVRNLGSRGLLERTAHAAAGLLRSTSDGRRSSRC